MRQLKLWALGSPSPFPAVAVLLSNLLVDVKLGDKGEAEVNKKTHCHLLAYPVIGMPCIL